MTATTQPDSPTDPAATLAPEATPLSPESLLSGQVSPSVVFDLVDGAILVVDVTGVQPPIRIPPPEGQEFISFAPSPGDDRVAALVRSTGTADQASIDAAIYDRAGETQDRWPGIAGATSVQASPVPDGPLADSPASPSVSWAPEGARLRVAPGGGELVTIDVGGDATILPVPPPVRRVEFAAWSPEDDQIALLARDEQGSAAIWVFSPYVDGVSMRQVAPPNADASNLGSVTKFAWLHDGAGLAFILSESSGPEATGGQLYTINLRLGIRLLVATAGRGGPAAEIVDFRPSPDGRRVAYEIAIPDGDGWQFHSLWVRPVQGEGVYEAPVRMADEVDGFWWAGNGLVFRQSSGGKIDYIATEAGANPRSVLAIDPGATPVAATAVPGTPVASPVQAMPADATPNAATPMAWPSDPAAPVSATPAG